MEEKAQKFILWFDEINKDDIPLVGGKNANLRRNVPKPC
jgi:pyruvate,water dikinase